MIRALIPSDHHRQQVRGGAGHASFALNLGEDRVRVSVYRVAAAAAAGHPEDDPAEGDAAEPALAAALRPLPRRAPTAAEIDLDPDLVRRLGALRGGLVIVAGAAGTGKSTTLWTLVEHINQTRRAHVLTIEDPVEYLFTPRRAVFSQRQLGEQVDDTAQAVRDALRQAPDVLLVGETRDYATLRAVLSAAESGQLVLTTLHTRRAHSTVARVLQMAPAAEEPQIRHLLAHHLQAVICQELPRRADGRGRVALREILLRQPAVSKAILAARDADVYNAMLKGQAEGMTVMERELVRLYQAGWVTDEEAARYRQLDLP